MFRYMLSPRRVVVLLLIGAGVLWRCMDVSLPSTRLSSSDPSFTEDNTCPACFGTSFCKEFYNNKIEVLGWSQYKLLSHINIRNVYLANYKGNLVILKKLGNKLQLNWLDKSICKRADRPSDCDVREVIGKLVENITTTGVEHPTLRESGLVGISDLTRCPSHRLIHLVLSRMVEGNRENRHSVLLTTMLMNPEPIFLQTFPEAGGWPFPGYIGACGRVTVMEYKGQPLTEFYNIPWIKRMKLASQLLDMAVHLTNNSLDFALYLTDVTHSNFAVDKKGKVWVIDTENVIVVDKLKIKADRPDRWNEPHANLYHGCSDCLSFEEADLCHHEITDHNVYVICQGLLAADAFSSPVEGGLLHSIPPSIDTRYNLSQLLQECADPRSPMGRLLVLPKLRSTAVDILQHTARLLEDDLTLTHGL